MTTDNRELLAVLKRELAFLRLGGYRQTAQAAWRPQFIFQDSPTCLNFDPTQPQKPCADCPLMHFIPEAAAREAVPCRYIPLNAQGQTIDHLYRTGTPEELEAAVGRWLERTIATLEKAEADPVCV